MDYHYEDFTEKSYRELLKIAKDNYRFISYDQCNLDEKMILWRHDIDLSVHRAFALAKIEAKEDIRSTYFIHLHSDHYNTLELEITRLLFKIIELGHNIGLHFDPMYYNLNIAESSNLEVYLKTEKEILEHLFDVSVGVFSFHNPDFGGDWTSVKHFKIAGMINTYSADIWNNFAYCSDSNGYWRYRRLKDVLLSAEEKKLQILTHPAWWTPEPMSPRQKITRDIDGRAAKTHNKYDSFLEKAGRKNLK